jgi:hypothetical protein
MLHGLRYHGAFELNRDDLAPGAETYRSTDGQIRPLVAWPAEVDGIRVGYMERAGKKFMAVRVQFAEFDVVLGTPLALDKIRHMGGRRFSARPTIITDDLASTLLDDVLECNMPQADELALLINRVNQVRRGDGPFVI